MTLLRQLCFAVRLVLQSKSRPGHSVLERAEVPNFNTASLAVTVYLFHVIWTLKTLQVSLQWFPHSSETSKHYDYLR